MKFSKYLILVLVCSVAILSACGSDQSDIVSAEDGNLTNNESLNLSNYPTGVKNGNVSAEYFSILEDTLIGFDHFISESKRTDIDNAEIKSLGREYLVYINGLNYSTNNSAEEELDRYFSSYLYNSKHAVEYKIKQLSGGSSTDESVANNYFKDANNDLLVLFDIMEKYELVNEM